MDKTSLDISVILPAYNEEDNISTVIKKSMNALSALKCNGEIIVVDDGSTDNTADKVMQTGFKEPQLYLIRHRKNRGLTEALITGFQQARADIVVFLCSDMQSDPEEDIPKLVNELKAGYDVVVGWRQGRRENKVFLSRIYNFVCSRLFNLHLHDMNWIKAFRREVVEDLELKSDWHRFILMLASHKGYRIGEVKTTWYPRRKGKSKFGFSRVSASFFDVMAIKFLLIFIDRPIRFFGFWGMLFIIVGFLILVYLVVLWFMMHIQLRPLMLFSLFSILIGIFILMIGFLAELISLQQVRLNKIAQHLKK